MMGDLGAEGRRMESILEEVKCHRQYVDSKARSGLLHAV